MLYSASGIGNLSGTTKSARGDTWSPVDGSGYTGDEARIRNIEAVGQRWIHSRIRECGEVGSDVLLFDKRSAGITWSVHITQLRGGLGPLCMILKAALIARACIRSPGMVVGQQG